MNFAKDICRKNLIVSSRKEVASHLIGVVAFLLFCLVAPMCSLAGDSLKKSAVFGDAEARFQLGSLYYHGDAGVSKDYKKAFMYLTKASEQGHEMATLILANMYLNGQGVEPDATVSYELIHAAAWKGLAGAQAILGLYYCDGIGVEKDISQCCAWYDTAAAQGLLEAQKSLAETVQQMTPAQITKATAISKDIWRKIVKNK